MATTIYNATYVRVYRTEPDAVWFGYTMGYLGAYLAWDTFVYGTGWAYPAYWDFGWAGGYWPYYPRPVTYGVGAFYNPVYGTFGRYGYAYGPYRGIAGGAAYNPRTGTYARGGVIAGPNGDRGFVAAFNPRTGTAAFAKGGHNVYGSWGTAGVRHGSDFARVSGGATDNAAGARWRTSDGNRGFVAGRDGGDIYAGRNGNVYRKDDGSWQKHTADGWKPVERPSAENIKKPGEHMAARHPELAEKIRSEPASERRADLAKRAESRPMPTKRPEAAERAADRRPTPARQQRPARQVRERVPGHVAIDRVGRHYGNQRELRHEFGRADGGNFGGREFGGRSGGFRGGGGFHGGGRFRR